MAAELGESLGVLGLFIAALLAASLLPFPVEAAVPAVVALGASTVSIVAAGALGGYLGSLINYQVAAAGSTWLESRRGAPRGLERAQAAFQRWGPPLLLLSWLPVVGEALTLVAGAARVRLLVFSIWTVIGRVVRMIALVQVSRFVLE